MESWWGTEMAFFFPFFLSFVYNLGIGQAGQGELPRAACGLTEVGADGEQDWTVHNLARSHASNE
jgi:hypothetical protein